ncbi:Holliday junction branch migration DNA helicase RuvB [bacterium]|nr:Holliday junction branch migration DNA helicase RuvB [bacterium]
MPEDRIVNPEPQEEDEPIDYTLRPQSLEEFIGQDRIKEQLKIAIEASKIRGQSLEHVLLVGPPGLGKTTLARIIANELGVGFKSTIGPTMERQLDLSAILTNLQNGDVLFIDEIHRMKNIVQEMLYPAMEDYKLDITIGEGPSANIVQIPLPRFTLIGATTREGLLTAPFRDRFGLHVHLDYYEVDDIYIIIKTNAKALKIDLDDEAGWEIALRARGTPRVAKRLLIRVWDYALYKTEAGIITKELAQDALEFYGIDELGLDDRDRKLLSIIIEQFGGRAVGLKAIAVAISEDERTIVDVYEPYLIQIGFLTLTKSGRVATEAAYEHLGIPLPQQRRFF